MLHTLVGLSQWKIAFLVVYLLWQGAIIPSMPEEVMVPTLGILWGQGRMNFWLGVVAVQIGLMGGDFILVTLGRHIGPKLLSRRPFNLIAGPDTVREATERLQKYGPWLIFITRFTPMVRAPMFFAAGVSKMPLWKFFRSDYSASCIFIPLLMVAGRQLGANSHSLQDAFQTLGVIMGTLLILALTYAYFRERKKSLSAQLRALEQLGVLAAETPEE
jgi:membrane protein DedA with SNARE-associated domain